MKRIKSIHAILDASGVTFETAICGQIVDDETGRHVDIYTCRLLKGTRSFIWEHTASSESTKHKEPPSLYCAVSCLNLWPLPKYATWLKLERRTDGLSAAREYERQRFQHAAMQTLLGQRKLEDLRLLV